MKYGYKNTEIYADFESIKKSCKKSYWLFYIFFKGFELSCSTQKESKKYPTGYASPHRRYS